MSKSTSRKLLHGIVVPTVTPLTEDGQLDEAGLERLIEHLLIGGVSGIFAVGTTGEGPALSREVRRQTVEATCRLVNGAIPVVVAAMDPSTREALATIGHAAECGADAVAVAPPYYLSLSEGDIVRFGHLVDRESPLPAYLYNVPYANLPQFSLEAISRLADCANLRGLKDSSGNFEQLVAAVELFAHRDECSVMVGPEKYLAAALRAGADGGVSGGGNLFPRLYANLYRAYLDDDERTLDRLQEDVIGVERDFYGVGESASSLVRGVKTGLSCLGICGPWLVEPYEPANPMQTNLVAERLSTYEIYNGARGAGIL